MEIKLKESERIDDLDRNGLKIIQDEGRFCFGMDAVLLSSFAAEKIRKNDKVLDLGTGTGIIPILLTAKCEASGYTALEIQDESVDMAKRSVMLNDLSEKINIVCGDIKEAGSIFGPASFHAVTSNPPYMIDNHGLKNDNSPKTIARHEVLCSLEDVIREGSKVLKDNGRFFMVHRPFRLSDIMNLMRKYKIEPKRMRLVYPYVDHEPNMVLIEGIKGGNPNLIVEKPLIVYQKVGKYTEEIIRIYKE